MSLKVSPILALCFSFFFLLSTVPAFNITQILSQYPDFSTFSNYLTQTQVAEQINGRQTLTVLAVENGKIPSISRLSMDIIKKVLSVHVILDYYDVPKLQNLQHKTALLTTLYQSSGQAIGQEGFLNVTVLSSGVAFGSAVPGSSLSANLVKSIASQPYNISVLQISNPIMPSGIGNANSTNSPSPPTPTPPSHSPANPPKSSPTPPAATPEKPPATKAPTPSNAEPPTPSSNAKPPTPSNANPPTPSNAKPPAASNAKPPGSSTAHPPGSSTAKPPASSNANPPIASAPTGTPSNGATSPANADSPTESPPSVVSTGPTADTPITSPPGMEGPTAATTTVADAPVVEGPSADAPAGGHSGAPAKIGINLPAIFVMIVSSAWALAKMI